MDSVTELFAELTHRVLTEHQAFDSRRNPLLRAEDALGPDALSYVAVQYSAFPKCIVDILLTAQAALREWPLVAAELARNVAEEQGSESGGRSHYDLFRSGMIEEYRLDPEAVPPAAATGHFLKGCFSAVSSTTEATAAGAIYAIEAVSAAELTIVRDLMNALSLARHGRPLPSKSTLGQFFEAHIDAFEPGHELGLRITIQRYIALQETRSLFAEGFDSMLTMMDRWWNGLARETISSR